MALPATAGRGGWRAKIVQLAEFATPIATGRARTGRNQQGGRGDRPAKNADEMGGRGTGRYQKNGRDRFSKPPPSATRPPLLKKTPQGSTAFTSIRAVRSSRDGREIWRPRSWRSTGGTTHIARPRGGTRELRRDHAGVSRLASAPAGEISVRSQSRAARCAAADLALAHQLGDLAAQPHRIPVAAHGGEIEPFVRRHVVGRRTLLPVEYIMPSWNSTSPEAFASPSTALSPPTTSNRAMSASPFFRAAMTQSAAACLPGHGRRCDHVGKI